jgi:F-type H+-transporting ATPase subunit delta
MAQVAPEKPKHDTVMDVTQEQLARVYSTAFLDAAGANSAGAVDEIGSFVRDVLAKNSRFDEVLRSEFIDPEQKEAVLERVLSGRASALVLNFLKVLAKRGRLVLLPQIARISRKLFDERSGRTDVEVRVARDLEPAMYDKILAELRSRWTTEPVIRVVVDPEIIAGIVLRSGDKVYDGSVKTQFELLRKTMIGHVAEKIETSRQGFVAS